MPVATNMYTLPDGVSERDHWSRLYNRFTIEPFPANQKPMSQPDSIFARLMTVIEDRKAKMPDGSYTTRLLAGGAGRISEKLAEETAELIEAATEPGEPGRAHVVHEAADLVYHLLVMLACRDVSLTQLEAELERRFGISGLDERSARAPS